MNDIDVALGELDRADRAARPARRADLHRRAGRAARRSRSFRPLFDRSRRARHPDPAAPGSRRRPAGLPDRNGEPLRHVARDRLALRHRVRDGAARPSPASSIGTPTSRSSRITWAVSRRTPSERIREGYDKLLNAARARNEPIALPAASARLLPAVLCRHHHDRLGPRAALRPRFLRRRSRHVRHRHAVRHAGRTASTSRSRSRRWRHIDVSRSRQGRRSSSTTPVASSSDCLPRRRPERHSDLASEQRCTLNIRRHSRPR